MAKRKKNKLESASIERDDCLFDKEGRINKREFLKRLGKIGGLTLTGFAFVGLPRRASADIMPGCQADPEGDWCHGDESAAHDVCVPAVTSGPHPQPEIGDTCSLPDVDEVHDLCVYPHGFIDWSGGDTCYPLPQTTKEGLTAWYDPGDDCVWPPYSDSQGDECPGGYVTYSYMDKPLPQQ